ncbi:cobaltochelatase subunit CobN [Zavarzinia compransoris]|uniref:Cobaltochelatase subunit CobN n=1 Tax=Zavarzinia compransoris TaxID=1264899 RepID=A0A317DU71_9PROT|nr:cobaltochelatase subunit CobN [Zavarzinia compransoris]PWR18238.1 cobaltochelatase subunit CobN [Zavarzinia compransoris]TDP40868.1 cobaltochelatase CobN subunit [Zavarzinia compransoris]
MGAILRLLPVLAALFFAVPAAAQPLRLLIVSNDFVLPGKVEALRPLAQGAGIEIAHLDVTKAEGAPAAWLAGAGLVIVDTPRPGDRATVAARLGEGLDTARIPWVQVGGGPPAFGHLPPDRARRIAAYYANGGRGNFAALFAFLSGADAPAVVAMPVQGLYHPAADALFLDAASYLAWGRERWPAGAPRIAIAVHGGTIADLQTRLLDTIVARAEARGIMPLVFWFDAGATDGIARVFGSDLPDIFVNAGHMQNAEARKAEFIALDRPVIQTLTYREGNAGDYAVAASGIDQRLVAPFLAVPEAWGMSDPLVIGALDGGEIVALPEQVDLLLGRAATIAALRRKPAAEKTVALMFWNAPAGDKNLSASNLNVPASIEAIAGALAGAGYDVPPTSEPALVAGAQAMLGALYRPAELDDLLARGLAVTFPISRYRAWLDRLPEDSRLAILLAGARPEDHWAVRRIDGEAQFVLPLMRLGRLALMPQPPRAARPGEHTHDVKQVPGHFYLAAYLYLREGLGADALIHLGTHGTQEWTPGKDRGLAATDYPFLALGDLPVFYPYIQDNVGEALQARRRGRAVTVSHQTPSFAPAGLHDELRDLHSLIHEHELAEDGPVRDATRARLVEAALSSGIAADLGLDRAAIEADVPGFLALLHDHLHHVAGQAMPLGLHRFGIAADPDHRLLTVMQQLGDDLLAAAGEDPAEARVEGTALLDSGAARWLRRYLRDGENPDDIPDETRRALVRRAIAQDRLLAEPGELEALLHGLAGGFVRPGPGGDPVRNPDLAAGRNLYGFEPDKIPTPAAFAAGGAAFAELLERHRAGHGGAMPAKLAFSLWSSEAMRHLGVLEAQVLHALGLRPVWDRGGRVVAIEIVPAAELGRPRVDAVIQVTSVYRDQFDGFMRLLAAAIDRLALLDEPGNPVFAHAAATRARLIAAGVPADRAARLAALRIFSNAPGAYGSGLPDEVIASDHWTDEGVLAQRFLDNLQYGYGAGDLWGIAGGEVNLFADQLRGVEGAVLARSSTLHGLISTDHPFEYLGGLGLAVRHLDGATPDLYVADLRQGQGSLTTAARFIADELRGRYLNPEWIKAMQAEGYAGTVELVKVANTVFGWQVTAPETIRADQWQALYETYVRDARALGLDQWFRSHNPDAQAQVMERMLEAIRKGYWDAPDETRATLAARFAELTGEPAVTAGSRTARDYARSLLAGFGLGAAAPAPAPAPGGGEAVSGQVMAPVPPPPPAGDWPWVRFGALAFILLAVGAGAIAQARVFQS